MTMNLKLIKNNIKLSLLTIICAICISAEPKDDILLQVNTSVSYGCKMYYRYTNYPLIIKVLKMVGLVPTKDDLAIIAYNRLYNLSIDYTSLYTKILIDQAVISRIRKTIETVSEPQGLYQKQLLSSIEDLSKVIFIIDVSPEKIKDYIRKTNNNITKEELVSFMEVYPELLIPGGEQSIPLEFRDSLIAIINYVRQNIKVLDSSSDIQKVQKHIPFTTETSEIALGYVLDALIASGANRVNQIILISTQPSLNSMGTIDVSNPAIVQSMVTFNTVYNQLLRQSNLSYMYDQLDSTS